MSTGIEPGTRFVRWTVLGPLPSQRRSGCMRRRSKVRCVCGHEQPAFDAELEMGRTKGCSSRDCMTRWEAMQLALAALRTLGCTDEELEDVRSVWLRALGKLRAGSVEEHDLPLGELHQLVLRGLEEWR